jgi:uncharacterized protein YoxC
MSDYWEVIIMVSLFSAVLHLYVDRLANEMNRRLDSIKSTLDRLEDKIDGVDRSSYRN